MKFRTPLRVPFVVTSFLVLRNSPSSCPTLRASGAAAEADPTVLGKQFSYNSAGRQPHNESNYYILAPESSTAKSARIARFPCATESSEVAFAQAFVQPTNGPESEDSASYNPETFEKIAENVKLR